MRLKDWRGGSSAIIHVQRTNAVGVSLEVTAIYNRKDLLSAIGQQWVCDDRTDWGLEVNEFVAIADCCRKSDVRFKSKPPGGYDEWIPAGSNNYSEPMYARISWEAVSGWARANKPLRLMVTPPWTVENPIDAPPARLTIRNAARQGTPPNCEQTAIYSGGTIYGVTVPDPFNPGIYQRAAGEGGSLLSWRDPENRKWNILTVQQTDALGNQYWIGGINQTPTPDWPDWSFGSNYKAGEVVKSQLGTFEAIVDIEESKEPAGSSEEWKPFRINDHIKCLAERDGIRVAFVGRYLEAKTFNAMTVEENGLEAFGLTPLGHVARISIEVIAFGWGTASHDLDPFFYSGDFPSMFVEIEGKIDGNDPDAWNLSGKIDPTDTVDPGSVSFSIA